MMDSTGLWPNWMHVFAGCELVFIIDIKIMSKKLSES